jgi:hypothetical protein
LATSERLNHLVNVQIPSKIASFSFWISEN